MRSPTTPNIGAISVPMNASEPNKVSSSTEPVSTSTYQPRMSVSISNAQEVSRSAATGSGSSGYGRVRARTAAPVHSKFDAAFHRVPPCPVLVLLGNLIQNEIGSLTCTQSSVDIRGVNYAGERENGVVRSRHRWAQNAPPLLLHCTSRLGSGALW